jgi:hypothetical protein
MMKLPSVEQALEDLERVPARGAMQVDLEVRVARFQAAVQVEAAEKMAQASAEAARVVAGASEALRASVDRFTDASNKGTAELATWSANTARWTRQLTFATWALVLVAIVQIVAAVIR